MARISKGAFCFHFTSRADVREALAEHMAFKVMDLVEALLGLMTRKDKGNKK